jgi:hypothetical protein
MKSTDNNEHSSNGGSDEFLNYPLDGITALPPLSDIAPLLETGLSAIPEHSLDPDSTIPLPSNRNLDRAIPSMLSSSPPHSIEIREVCSRRIIHDESRCKTYQTRTEANDDGALLLPDPIPDPIAASFEHRGKEGKWEEVDDIEANIPPEMIVASYELSDDAAKKPELIDDNNGGRVNNDGVSDNDAPLPPDAIAAYSEAQGVEEEKWEEVDDIEAPVPLEMIVASYELSDDAAKKPELIDDNNGGYVNNDGVSDNDAPLPPDAIAAYSEAQGVEEEKWEEVDDIEAPVPPEMIVASYELSDDAAKKPELIDDNNGGYVNNDGVSDNDAPLPPDAIAASFEKQEVEEEKWEEVDDIEAPVPPEMIVASFESSAESDAKNALEMNRDSDIVCVPLEQTDPEKVLNVALNETFESGGVMPSTNTDYSVAEIMRNNEAGRVFTSSSITPPDRRCDELILPVSGQDNVGFIVDPNPDVMLHLQPNIDPSYQPLPLLEGTLVRDLSEAPIYDAFPINSTQDNHSGGLFMRARKYKMIIIGWVLLATTGFIAAVVMAIHRNAIQPIESNTSSDTTMTSTTSTIALVSEY